MKGKEANPAYRDYRVQHGIIDLERLELVALQRVSEASWMPHFRSIPSRSPRSHTQERVDPPQRGWEVSQGDTMEGREVHGRSSIPSPVHPAEEVTAEAREQTPIPGPAHPRPTPISLAARNRVSPLKFQGFIPLCLRGPPRMSRSWTPADLVVLLVPVSAGGPIRTPKTAHQRQSCSM